MRTATHSYLMAKKQQKNPAAVALGRKGGQARAKRLTKAERSEAARKAAKVRWAQRKEQTP